LSFKDRVVIVTGAGNGLGRAYALHFARLGARVVVNNRRRVVGEDGLSPADRVVADIRAAGGEAAANYESVEDPASGMRMVQQALDTWGRLDALVANAGVSQGMTFHKIALDEYRRIFDINFYGTVHVAHAAYAVMRNAGYGRIVLTSSSGGLYGVHGLSAYGAAKAAVLGLARTLAHEGRARNVLTNVIAPYAVSQMTEALASDRYKEIMRPERVAPIVAYLASEQARLNGEVLIGGGGRFRRAAVLESVGGPFVDPDGLPSAAVDADLDRICDMSGAREFTDGIAETDDLLASFRLPGN
jgi:NAD(P)-dependent dehydrogenase (short-subunit alcohol dehydrogenase family)